MITDLKPYPEYKESEIEWIGEIPVQWEVKRNKFIMCEVNNRSQDGSEELLTVSQYTGISRRRERQSETGKLLTNADSLVGYKIVEPNDLVMNIMLAWNGSLGVSTLKGIVSPAYCVYRTQDNIHPRYIHYLLRTNTFTSAFKTVSTGIVESRLRLYPEVFLRLPSLLPPLSEQTAIVRFLDYMNRRIRRYIRAKQKLIKLLEEQKQVVINKAVTRGLDPNVRLKTSGVEWLGDVPEHWEKATKMKYLSSLKGRLGWQGLKAHEYTESGPYVVSSAHFKNHKINWEKCPHVSKYRYEMDANIQLSIGDILLMKDGAAMGKLAYVDNLPSSACLNSHLLLFRPLITNLGAKYDSKFMFYYMLTKSFQSYVQSNGTGATFMGISQEDLGNYKISLPPLHEQLLIARFLDKQTKTQDDLIALVYKQIELLQEYRTRLNADVITGKVDIREIAAQLPDEFEEEEIIDEDEIISDNEVEEYSEDSFAEAEA